MVKILDFCKAKTVLSVKPSFEKNIIFSVFWGNKNYTIERFFYNPQACSFRVII